MKNATLLKTVGGLPDIWVIANWKSVLKRAWSLRLMIVVIILGSIGPALPVIDEVVYVPRLLYAAAIIVTGIAGLVARFIPQKGVTDGQV